MLFTTYTFVVFFIAVLLLRWVLPERAKEPLLLAASLAFYASWSVTYLPLPITTAAITWAFARLIELRPERKRLWMALGVLSCLGVLLYFKYTGFLIIEANVLRERLALGPWPVPTIVLPLGVSFFTFQMISYVVDVYRGMRAERSFFRYLLFISFFPHQIAGPLLRGPELLPQLPSRQRFEERRFLDGVDLFALGSVKKLVFADNFARWSDPVFAAPGHHGTAATWAAVLAYAGQIYCDFSAYSDIARGVGKMLGFELPRNFDTPYLSASITEFWRRWHITLSEWLRDYVYVPLGGNRRGRPRQYLNLVITMGLGGLWHGASFTFVLWGLFHGVLLLAHKAIDAGLRAGFGERGERLRRSFVYRVLATASTFAMVCVGWVLFRATDLETARSIYEGMLGLRDVPLVSPIPRTLEIVLGLLVALFVGQLLGRFAPLHRLDGRVPPFVRGVSWSAALALAYVLGVSGGEFIYFQF